MTARAIPSTTADTTAPNTAPNTAPTADTTAPTESGETRTESAAMALAAIAETNPGRGAAAIAARTDGWSDVIRGVRVNDRAAMLGECAAVPTLAAHLADLVRIAVGADAVPYGRDPRAAIAARLAEFVTAFGAVLDECQRRGVAIPATMADIPAGPYPTAAVTDAARLVDRWARATGSGNRARNDQGRDTASGRADNMARLVGQTLHYRYGAGATGADPVMLTATVAADGDRYIVTATGVTGDPARSLSAALGRAILATGRFTPTTAGGRPSVNGWSDWHVGSIDGPTAAEYVAAS